jgi:ClpP class serine protease
MRFARIQDAVYRQPWNITAGGWLSVHEVVQSALAREYKNGMFADFVNERPEMEIDTNGIAHIHVQGVLGKGLSKIEKSCGNTGYEQLEDDFDEAEQRGARGVMMHINSPGGATVGNAEIATRVSESPLPKVAFVDDLCASAAYSIAAGCNHIVCTPSAEVGSIGTIIPMIDQSGAWKAQGWEPAYITHTGGDLKAAGYPPSMTEAQREYLQEVVDDLFGLFRGHVLAHRSIDASAMRGQCLVGQRALDANLVDTVGTYTNAYEEILKRANP